MSGRIRWVLLAALLVVVISPGVATDARRTVQRWWTDTVASPIDEAERSTVIPADAPPLVTVICRERFHDAGHRFPARRGERVMCPNDAVPQWVPAPG